MMDAVPGMGFGDLGIGLPFMLMLLLWALFWKGLALWHAARRDEPWWFVALLVFNTMGLLEILYLFVFAKLSLKTLFERSRE